MSGAAPDQTGGPWDVLNFLNGYQGGDRNLFQNGDANMDGNVDLVEAFNYYDDSYPGRYPVFLDGLEYDSNRQLPILSPAISSASQNFLDGATRKILDLEFVIEGPGQVTGVDVKLMDSTGAFFQTESLTLNSPNGQGLYTPPDIISTTSAIEAYVIDVSYSNPSYDFVWASDVKFGNVDDDLDGLSNAEEYYMGLTSPLIPDDDGDGIPDGWEIYHGLNPCDHSDALLDPDNDGAITLLEYACVLEPRNWLHVESTDPHNPDMDHDDLPDGWEIIYDTDPFVVSTENDLDYDGLSNIVEYGLGTHPRNADTDGDILEDGFEISIGTSPLIMDTEGDGMPDGWEWENSLNPLIDDRFLDEDGDGLTNIVEYNLGTEPDDTDSDDDTMPDDYEVDHGLEPTIDDRGLDLDEDSLTNIFEFDYGTSPSNPDSDGDTMPDGWEWGNSLNPLIDDRFLDEDGDGLTNIVEFNLGTEPDDTDSDDDTMPDGWEVDYSLDPLLDDTGLDPDSDGLENLLEYQIGTNPQSQDTDSDNVMDRVEYLLALDPLDPESNMDGYFFNKPSSDVVFKYRGPEETILITSNADFTEANGVLNWDDDNAGTTEDNPYIIQGWIFTPEGSTQNAIRIQTTDVYFVIQYCYISCYGNLISLDQVSSGTIANNYLSDVGEDCILLRESHYNLIQYNDISHTYHGIFLTIGCGNNIIKNNIIRDNIAKGLNFAYNAENNLIYQNNFEGNPTHVDSSVTTTNSFNFKGIGNYWDDYTGSDADLDGIGDTPYLVSGSNYDNYPLVNRYDFVYPVVINGDDELLAFCAGQSGPPYIIENLLVDGEHGARSCLKISYTTYDLEIRGCFFTAIENPQEGVELQGCSNVLVEDCIVTDSQNVGIWLEHCSSCEVNGNFVRGIENSGIHVGKSSSVEVTNNIMNDCRFGVNNYVSNKATITGNIINDCYYGINVFNTHVQDTIIPIVRQNVLTGNVVGISVSRSSGVRIRTNNFDGLTEYAGIQLSHSSNCEINSNNQFYDVEYGIYLSYSSSNVIDGNYFHTVYEPIKFKDSSSGNTIGSNTFIACTYGIFDPRGFNNTFIDNYFNGADIAIFLDDMVGTRIENNTFVDCNIGILSFFSTDSIIQKNNFTNCSNYAIMIQNDSTNNTITQNQFINNNNGGIQCYDDVGSNTWTNNYWSDYETRYPDAEKDGIIWSEPYVIDGSLGISDTAAYIYPDVDDILDVFGNISSKLDDLEGLIENNLQNGKKVACLVLLDLARASLNDMVDEYMQLGDISTNSIKSLQNKLFAIDKVANKPVITDKYEEILDLIALLP
ncbi:MAG: NosD domain-containing protein [Candidatus Hodarchaeota archaeon]